MVVEEVIVSGELVAVWSLLRGNCPAIAEDWIPFGWFLVFFFCYLKKKLKKKICTKL